MWLKKQYTKKSNIQKQNAVIMFRKVKARFSSVLGNLINAIIFHIAPLIKTIMAMKDKTLTVFS